MATRTDIEDFYREHASAVLGFLVSLSRDRNVAEDLLQDTFIKATRALGAYRGGSPRAWLFAIARSTFIDHTRRRRIDPVDDLDTTAPPDTDVVERLTIEHVLGRIPERQRTALVLADQVGMPAAEVAATFGISPGAARVLIHRARHTFRTIYEEQST